MQPSLQPDFKQRLKDEAFRLGFADCGVTTAEALPPELETHFLQWLELGYHDRMEYLAREPLRRTRPELLLEDAHSVICLSVRYASGGWLAKEEPATEGHGRVARYARGEDYHLVLDQPLRELETWLVHEGGASTRTRRFCDAGPLLEKDFAQRAGLGFIGRNTLLIKPGVGSWMLLAAIVTNLPIEPDPPFTGTCASCRRCLDACPTGALTEPYVLDARRCISNLTIERKGEFSNEEKAMIGDWVFGCDICQEVCPYNKPATEASLPGLDPIRFPNGQMRLSDLAEIRSNGQYEKQFAASPLLRARLKGLRRNALAVQENQARK